MADVQGTVAPGFEGVRDAFERNFDEHGDVGAGFSLYVDGECVVDLVGGVTEPGGTEPYGPDALAARLLVDQGRDRDVRPHPRRPGRARLRRPGDRVLARVRRGRQGRRAGELADVPPGRAASTSTGR